MQSGEPEVYVESGSSLSWGTGNIDADPCFAFANDLHLISGSSCIDTGTNSPSGGLPTTDLAGYTRAMDGDENGSSVVDMGAYEFDPDSSYIALSPTQMVFVVRENDPNGDSQTLSIRNAGGETLVWQINDSCPWLQADPNTGQSTGEIDEVDVYVDVASLSPGAYTYQMTVSDDQAANNPRVVNITLHIGTNILVPDDYSTIQAAIDAAISGDTIIIDPNTYTGPGNRDLDFGGKAITVRSINPNDPCVVAATIIDCNGSAAEPHRGFFFNSGEGSDSILDGLAIINGYGPAVSFPENSGGGGIFCYASSPTIRNCVIRDCSTAGGGWWNNHE